MSGAVPEAGANPAVRLGNLLFHYRNGLFPVVLLALLLGAGYSKFQLFFRWYNFGGMIAVK